MTKTFDIYEANLDQADIQSLIAFHMSGMHANSPPQNVCGLDLSGLRIPAITMFCARDNVKLAAIGALKALGHAHGEIKSMRVHPDFERQGAGKAILEHIIETAKARGYSQLSLETGSGTAFDAAIGLYLKYDFVRGDAFGDYPISEFNRFYHLAL